MLGVRLDQELEERLSALAKRTERPKSYHAKQALMRYLDQEEAREAVNRDTLSRWEAFQENGETITNDQVLEWMDTWGTDDGGPWPQK
jgi:predicted transcriptional regulator